MTDPLAGADVSLSASEASDVMRALIRDLRAQLRNGAPVPPWAHKLLPQLAAIADRPFDSADIGTPVATVGPTDWLHMVPIDEAAHNIGLSHTYLRRLAREGRVLSRRINGRAWVVDLDSVRRVTGRAA